MIRFRLTLGAVLLAPLPSHAQTATGIELENAAFSQEVATGSCGPARIEIVGVDRDNPHDTKRLIPGYQASVTIRSGGKTLKIGDGGDPAINLESFAKLHCVSTPSGKRLVLAAHCASNYCLPISFSVIDPRSLRLLSKGYDLGCDEECAKEALGTELPSHLKATLN